MSAFICPRCQQANFCLAGTPQVAQCWCMQVKFPTELLQTTTQSQCICQQCLQQAIRQLPAKDAEVPNAVQYCTPPQSSTA